MDSVEELLRDKFYNLCLDKLEENYDVKENEDLEKLEKISCGIEKGLYENYGKDKTKYRKEARKIISNITITPNASNVRNRLYNNIWDPESIATMTPEQLYPELIEEQQRKILEDEQTIKEFNEQKLKTKSIYTCNKCRSNAVEYTQQQVRSSDEAMSVFCYCLNCGKRWKF